MTGGGTDLDWPALVLRADAEGLCGLLLDAIDRLGLALPSDLRTQLQHEGYQVAAANAWLGAETGRIVEALHRAVIEPMLLKGAAMAGWLYPDPAFRRMGDIDLLIRREQADAAQTVLESLGYAQAVAEIRPGSDLRFESQRMMLRQAPPATLVELHWQLFDEPFYQERVPIDWFWEHARPAGDGPATRLDATAMLLHLCGHLALHHGQAGHPRLRWQHDIAALVHLERAAIDGDEILARARDWQLIGALRQGLLPLMDPPWRLALPSGLAEALARLGPDATERRVLAARQASLSPAWRLWRDLQGMGSWRRRLAFLVAQVLPDADYLRWRYGAGPLPLLYMRRWCRGIGQLARGLTRERNSGP